MELFKRRTNIDFMAWRRSAAALSIALVLVSIGLIAVRGLNFTVDFTGGILIELGFERQADPEEIRRVLADAGHPASSVQYYGSATDVLVRMPGGGDGQASVSDEIVRTLKNRLGAGIDVRRIDFVGPQVGEELTEQGGLAMLIALAAILVYVGMRFEWRFAVGSVIALVHDVMITLGFFSLFWFDFDLSVFASVLAVIGYSLNDTIVVFDRARENFRLMRKATSLEVFNRSLNDTLSRTLMTGITTLLVLVALLVFGGPTLFGFSIALIIGILVGTYSSIYIASAAALALGVSRSDLVVPKAQEDGEPPHTGVRTTGRAARRGKSDGE